MKAKVCIVTGATSGIGLATAIGLAHKGATVVVVGRNPAKGTMALARIQNETGNPSARFLQADLSVLAEVRRVARELETSYARVDVLINNVGGFFMRREMSVDSIEMSFALNYLSGFLLTHLLLDMLKASAPARIVNVSSDAHRNGQIRFDDLFGERKYRGTDAYTQSKLAMVLFTYELARRIAGSSVVANVVHPGIIATDIWYGAGKWIRPLYPLIRLLAKSPEEGAKTSIHVASSPEIEGTAGKYFSHCKQARSAQATYDAAVGQRLWEISTELVSL